MSRNVPLDRALEDADRAYLRQLGAAGAFLERRIDGEFPPDPETLEAFERAQRKYLASVNGTGLVTSEQDALMAENERLRAELKALKENQPPPSEDSAPKAPSYTGWTKAQLEAEVDRVNSEDPEANLSKGKVADMVTALTDYFTE